MTAARLVQLASLVVSSDSYGQYAARALASNTSDIAKANLMEVLRKPSSHWYTILCCFFFVFPSSFSDLGIHPGMQWPGLLVLALQGPG